MANTGQIETGKVSGGADKPPPGAEPSATQLVRYKLRLGFWQAIWGTLISGGVAVAIPAAVDAYKARIDLLLKQAEIKNKAQDFHQTYIAAFLNTALNQDIELRMRFSEYFSYVSDEDSLNAWKEFHKRLEQRRTEVRVSINANEEMAATLRAIKDPTISQQIELSRIVRELDWSYAEVGYVRQNSNITVPEQSSLSVMIDRQSIISDNSNLFKSALIEEKYLDRVKNAAENLVKDKIRYESVGNLTGVPWYVVGILHQVETGGDFSTNLSNGDPLSARTVNVPAGRPPKGEPPFSWEEAAVDALEFAGMTGGNSDRYSSISSILFELEKYNGLGYRRKGFASPYIWGCTNMYKSGYYLTDGVFDPLGISPNCGAASMIKELMELKYIEARI